MACAMSVLFKTLFIHTTQYAEGLTFSGASLDVEIRIEARGYTSLEASRMHP
jgi:hypothetical protein